MNVHRIWRLVRSAPLPAAENMAMDEALLRCFDPRASLPILRLYRWAPPALSLGRFQNAPQVLDLERCRASSLAVVRRITGGGAIYHADELTYSLICTPAQIPPARTIKDSFRVLTGFLIAFYARLGLQAAYARDALQMGTQLGRRTPFCFAGRESFDILIHGRKIGGNAQRRQRGLIFQHGSIPLSCQAEAGLSFMVDRSPAYALGAVSLAQCGIRAEPDRLQGELVTAFRDHFGVECREEPLSSQERSCANELIINKYATDAWNMGEVER
jgi:lipoate-protein ligase A